MNYFEAGSLDNMIISNSSMSTINPEQDGHPLKFREFINNKLERKETSSLRLGSAIDKWVESPEDFDELIAEEIVRPEEAWVNVVNEMINLLEEGHEENNDLILNARTRVNFQSRWGNDTVLKHYLEKGKDYYEFLKENKGKIILTGEEKNNLESMKGSILTNHYANKLFFEPQPNEIHFKQPAIFFKFPVKIKVDGKEIEVVLKCKCLLDHLILNNSNDTFFVNDLKIIGKHSLSNFHKSFEYYRYYRQLAFYILAVQMWLMGKATMFDRKGNKVNIPVKPAPQSRVYPAIIGVESKDYFGCEYIPVKYDSMWLTKGTNEYLDILKRIAWHVHTDNWDNHKEVIENNGIRPIKEPEK